MNIYRNVLKIVAGALLLASLPAGAQVLGGSLGGAANGTLGGTLGGARIDGAASAAGHAGFDASDTFGAASAGARQAGSKTHETAGRAVGAAHSRVESTRGGAEASVQTAHSAGVRASRRAARRAARTGASASAEQRGAAQIDTRPSGGALLNGAGEAHSEQHAFGRSIAAQASADSQTSANRSGLSSKTDGQAGVSTQSNERQAPPAN
jgi:hypothetical protein